MSNGILSLTEKTLKMLKQKHPEVNETLPPPPSPPHEILLEGPKQPVQLIVHEDMGKPFILEAAMLTKGGSGPSGLDDDDWRKILT